MNKDCFGVYLNLVFRRKWFCFAETVKRTSCQSHSNRHLNQIQGPLLSFSEEQEDRMSLRAISGKIAN